MSTVVYLLPDMYGVRYRVSVYVRSRAGVKLLPAEMPTDGSAVFAAYAVFSEDSLRAELFLPERGGIVLDRRTLPSGGYAWNIEDDDTYNLRRDVSGEWIAEKRGNVLYRQAMEK